MNVDLLIADAPNLRLETERLTVRTMTAADLPTAIEHEKNRDIMHWIRDPLPDAELEEKCRAVLEPYRGEDGEWQILVVQPKDPEGSPMIGIVCCRVTTAEHETMEFGYRLHPDVQRQGFGFEACTGLIDYLFTRIGVRRLVAFCVTENEASWRLMEKLGMTREATFREYSRLAGQWRDESVYGLLHREWQAKR